MAANWKLAVENYLECYHCLPAHPEYAKLHKSMAKAGAIQKITVHVQGDGEVLISGEPTTSGPIQISKGTHLLQLPDGDHWKAEWRELVGDAIIQL